MVQTVRQFVEDCYQLVSSNSPTVPLYGNDLQKGIQFLNELLEYYSGTGQLITIPKTVSTTVITDQGEITYGAAGLTPPADVEEGRLANLENAWLILAGVTYPLSYESRNDFQATYRFDPLKGLPRFVFFYPEVDRTRLRIYPAPSQQYELFVYGKFQLRELTANDNMSLVPSYYRRFFKFAVAKDYAFYKSREEAWTPKLEQQLIEARDEMISITPVNLKLNEDYDDYLNGAWRVRAGI